MAANENLKNFYILLLDLKEPKQIAYFTQHLKVSTKTIYNYLKELEYELRPFDLHVEKRRGEGYLLVGAEDERDVFRRYLEETYLTQDFTDFRRKELLENLLMKDETVSVRKLVEKYDVAKSSIVNDLEYVDKVLQKNELFLVRDKSGTYVSGKEQHIRSAKRNYVFEKFKEKLSAKESYDLKTCKAILANYVAKRYMEIAEEMITFVNDKLSCELMDDMYYYQIFIQFAIFLDRVEKEHLLIQTTYRPVVSELHRLKTYPVTLELAQWLKNTYGIALKDQDVRWLNARVSGVYHENDIHSVSRKAEEIRSQLSEFIETISAVVGENLNDDEELFKGLQQHVVPMMTRITNKIKITNPFLPQIKAQYPALFSVLVLAASTFENSLNIHLSDDEISFLLIHVQAAIERYNLSKKIAIVIHSSGANADLVEHRVKRNLPRFDVVETFNLDDLKLSYLDDFDFIISTVEIAYDKKPVILISPLVDEYDVHKINQICADTSKHKESVKNLLLEKLDKETLLLKQDYEDKDTVLEKIHTIFMRNGYVSEGFLASMKERERMAPTEMGNGLAIPHGISKYVKKEKILVMTLKKPIVWDKEKVDIIICLAFNFADKERSRKLISNIYQFIKSKDTIHRVRECTTEKAFYEIVRSL